MLGPCLLKGLAVHSNLGFLPLESLAIPHLTAAETAPNAQFHSRAADYATSSEAALLNGLHNGDPGADLAFFDRYERDVRMVLTRIMGASPDVADALQETFIRAFKHALRVRDAFALRAWVRRVANSVAFDHLRERQRRSWQVDSHRAIENATVDHVTAEVRAASRDVYRVLEKLPSAERAAFRLRYVDEMDMSEVAAACRVSLATAKRRLARAESRFRTLALRQPGLADLMQSQNA